MAGQIRISPDQIRSRANEYRQQANEIQEVISRLDTLLSQIQTEWEGEASRAYEARFQEVRPAFVKASELVNGFATGIDNVAQVLEQTDAELANSFRA